jgi:undecaprenyl-diphosphatase
MRHRALVKALVSVILFLATLMLGLLARTAPVTRRDLHVDRFAEQFRFPAGTDFFLALTGAASEVVGLAVLLAGVIVLVSRRRRWDALRLLAAAGGSWAMAIGVKDIIDRPRPPASLWALTPDSSGSFPSGHDTTACIAVVVAFMALRGTGRARLWVIGAAGLFAVAVGASRVYLGDHYPTDVLGSWFVVATVSAAVWTLSDVPLVRRTARAILRDPTPEPEARFA